MYNRSYKLEFVSSDSEAAKEYFKKVFRVRALKFEIERVNLK